MDYSGHVVILYGLSDKVKSVLVACRIQTMEVHEERSEPDVTPLVSPPSSGPTLKMRTIFVGGETQEITGSISELQNALSAFKVFSGKCLERILIWDPVSKRDVTGAALLGREPMLTDARMQGVIDMLEVFAVFGEPALLHFCTEKAFTHTFQRPNNEQRGYWGRKITGHEVTMELRLVSGCDPGYVFYNDMLIYQGVTPCFGFNECATALVAINKACVSPHPVASIGDDAVARATWESIDRSSWETAGRKPPMANRTPTIAELGKGDAKVIIANSDFF